MAGKKHFARITAQLAAGMAVLAAPAVHATPWNTGAVSAATQFAAGHLAVSSLMTSQCGAAPLAVTRIAAPQPAKPMSALERIRMRQAGFAKAAGPVASADVEAQPAGVKMTPAAAGIGCANIAPAAGFAFPAKPALNAGRGTDFLASKIMPISRTAFDSAWSRVSSHGAGRANVRAASLSVGQGATARDKVAAVNRWVNARISFTDDMRNYGRKDYWADAAETLRRGKGDCEDYAIAKMQILAAMGVSRDDMYLTLARDNIRRIDHAVLIVKLDGAVLMLDNGSDELLDGSAANDYRPVYSFSGDKRYLHGF